MSDPFITPTLVDEYVGAVEDRWGNCAETGVYLLYHWLKVLLHVVSQFQRDSYENYSGDEDIVSCEWMKEIFINYSDPALIKRMYGKYEALGGLDKGGITYLKIDLDEIFNMSDIVITLLQEFFKNFDRDGVARQPSENVVLLIQKINAVAYQLIEVSALPRDTTLLTLTGFTKFSVTKFIGIFELMINTERVIQLENDGDRNDHRK